MGRFKEIDKVLKVLAIVLAILVLICLIPSWVTKAYYYQDRLAIDARYKEFHEAMGKGDYETGYLYMSPEYRQTHPIDEFQYGISGSEGESWLALHPKRYLKISGDKAYLYPGNQWVIFWAGPTYELVKVKGEWYFTGEYTWSYD
jgi:hypothetical protein